MNLFTACAASLLLASVAAADTYTFNCVSDNVALSATNGEAQLRMDVTDPGSNRVNFRLYWNGPVPMAITQVYFDDEGSGAGVLGAFLSSDLSGPTGVAFSQGANPGHLPAGGNFETSAGLLAGANNPAPKNGVNKAFPTEYLDISIPLLSGKTFADAILALNQGFINTGNRGLRVGMHVQAIGADGAYQGAGGSESFINNPQLAVVPLPPAAWAGLGTLAVVVGAGLKRRRAV